MAKITHSQGLTFEEFEVGDTTSSLSRTITETDIVNFAGISGDFNQLHTDAEFGKGTIFGERVAHGLLILSIASGLAMRTGFLEGTAQALMSIDWKLRAPVLIGDTIRVEAKVARKKEMKRLGGAFITFDMTVFNQRDEVVQRGNWTVLVRGRDEE